MFISMRGLLACLFAGMALSAPATAQDLPLNARQEIISEIIARFGTDYYAPADAQPYLSRLRQLGAEAEQAPAEPDAFALWLHHELQAVRRDGHLGVYGQTRTAAIMGDDHFEGTDADTDASFFSTYAPQEGVLVLRLEQFAASEADTDLLIATLAGTPRDTRLVFDLRGNRGGGATLFRMIAGCFFAEPEPLFAIDWRREGVRESVSEANPECAQHQDATIYVLVDNGTASTAELMPFVLQARGRAVVVGEPTYGASHAAEMYRLPAGFGLMLPIGRTYDPVTGLDWETTGVTPNIASASDDALDTALAHIRSANLCSALSAAAPGFECVVGD